MDLLTVHRHRKKLRLKLIQTCAEVDHYLGLIKKYQQQVKLKRIKSSLLPKIDQAYLEAPP